ncbi:DNA polymerase B2 protein [Halorhabdus tiamatea SARL4B]|uniref:DNA-directed DNA polymerase n=1 Tax=Halorhabdus tiamatea SARL4B TaxID=1033806 RepID=F7PGU0_9EURY|nr:type B DNA-directed DNA polymerase [Halorhabdus tiamatea]ERJ06713.1 DNA polymerase B2 protein [Halorhabdus tiamatea SARL4B]CCQ33903.1 archaeal DNA polymerase I [Halorhabdus tiamatea SARL4B]
MVFTIDFLGDGDPLVWSLDGTVEQPSWSTSRAAAYRPTVYAVAARGMTDRDLDPEACIADLTDLQADLDMHPAVADLRFEWKSPGFRFADQPVLRIAVDRVGAVREVARFVEDRGPPGRVPYRAFDVDFSPEFRYCLETGIDPTPGRPPRVLRLDLPRTAAAAGDLTALAIGARTTAPTASTATTSPDSAAMRPAGDTVEAVLGTLRRRLAADDPDVLWVERADILPLLDETATEYGIDLGLQRVPSGESRDEIPAVQRLAGASTFESYGRRMHSPARYNVPGRVVIDRSNTFFLGETNLAGALDLVARSGKPLQELSWASIGNVLTAIQIRAVRERDVLVQWRAWRPERFKTARTLHDADRGGTTLSPAVGVHDAVHELDFASMYPNVICEHNLSPETVRCSCHDGEDVPELGYSVCDREGYLPDVLQPIVDDRAEMKRRLAEDDLSAAERRAIQGQVDALKWILVSCFGYQGFSNAKFGRIEVHEAINAHARDVLLTAKERLEAGGWRVLHGIVDSIWVTAREGATQEPLDAIAAEITDDVGIALEHEGAFEWVAFCPRRDGEGGALTKYVGRRRNAGEDDPYKVRGLACRQRSTPAWVAGLQRSLVETFDETREAGAVIDTLAAHLAVLAAGDVPTTDLLVRNRASKDVDAYTHRTRTVAALERADSIGLDYAPGEDVVYVVRDDDRDGMGRVRLAPEIDNGSDYDAGYYREAAIRAATGVLGPLGWTDADVRDALAGERDATLSAFDVVDRGHQTDSSVSRESGH